MERALHVLARQKAPPVSPEMRRGHPWRSISDTVLSLHFHEDTRLEKLSSYLNVSIPTRRAPRLVQAEELQGARQKRWLVRFVI